MAKFSADDIGDMVKPQNAMWHTYASHVGVGINKKYQIQIGGSLFRVLNSASGKNEVEYEGNNPEISVSIYHGIQKV